MIIAECRAHSEAAIVLGGAGFSIFPQASLNYLGAHMGIRGEGERAFISLLDALSRSGRTAGIPGLYTRDSAPAEIPRYVEDLDELPLPDPGIASQCAPDKDEIWMPFQTRRGCPMGCSYCSTPVLEGCTIRKRRVESVIKSLSAHTDAGFKKFYFVDNTFNMPLLSHGNGGAIKQAASLWYGAACLPLPNGQELANLLSRAGCREAGMGFEKRHA